MFRSRFPRDASVIALSVQRIRFAMHAAAFSSLTYACYSAAAAKNQTALELEATATRTRSIARLRTNIRVICQHHAVEHRLPELEVSTRAPWPTIFPCAHPLCSFRFLGPSDCQADIAERSQDNVPDTHEALAGKLRSKAGPPPHPSSSSAYQRNLSGSANPSLRAISMLSPARPSFSPRESAPPPLPCLSEGRVDHVLPRRPDNVCDACWECLFSKHLGLPCMSPTNGEYQMRRPEAISYSISLAAMESRASAGCIWCQLLFPRAQYSKYWPHWNPNPDSSSNITVQGFLETGGEGFSIQDYQGLYVEVDGYPIFNGFVYTAPGTSRYATY